MKVRERQDPALAILIERSAKLKRQLVEFAESPRFHRWLTPLLQEAAGPGGGLDEGAAISVIDHFALQYRLPDGERVLDRFIRHCGTELASADRDMLLGWGDVVEGIFEVRHKHKDSVGLLNLLDDLGYRVYANTGPAVFRQVPEGGFVIARIVPIAPVADAWLVSGALSAYPRSSARVIADIAINMAQERPELLLRNPEKVELAWQMMRRNRAEFIEYFGIDELVLPPSEAGKQIDAQLRQQQEAAIAASPERARRGRALVPEIDGPMFELPEELYAFDTVGIIFDDIDGLNFYPDYGMLRDLFAEPGLAKDKTYADLLRTYLRVETIGPLPLRRLAAAYPENADDVYRSVLRQPHFTWAEHGEALLRKRKAWYYEREPRPGVSVIGNRLAELAGRR